MLSEKTEAIYRRLCMVPGQTINQKELANYAECSKPYVNKVIKKLKKNNFIDQPSKNFIKVKDFQGLVLFWVYHKNINEELKIIQTDYSVDELQNYICKNIKSSVHKGKEDTYWEPSLFWGSIERGLKIKYTTYDLVSVYCKEEITNKFKEEIKKGNKAKLGYIEVKKPNEYTHPIQVFADLISFNTWESKSVAIKFLEREEYYPTFTDLRTLNEILNIDIGVKNV